MRPPEQGFQCVFLHSLQIPANSMLEHHPYPMTLILTLPHLSTFSAKYIPEPGHNVAFAVRVLPNKLDCIGISLRAWSVIQKVNESAQYRFKSRMNAGWE